MTKTLGIFSTLMVVFLAISCGQKHTASEIVLDEGKPWIANPETTVGINNMLMLMDTFKGSDDHKAYKDLASNLSDEFQMIFKNCTMEGEAHNQLHNYLLPMKDMFDGLESKEISVQKQSFETLKAHLISYPNYFQ